MGFRDYKKEKPQMVEGLLEKIELGEIKKAAYVGMDNYRIDILTVDSKKYEYLMPVSEAYEVNVGEKVCFRTKSSQKNSIEKRSLGRKIEIPKQEIKTDENTAVSQDILDKLKKREDAFKITDGSADWVPQGARLKIKPR